MPLTATRPFEVVGPNAPDWDAFVDAHPKGSVFHTAAMTRVFAAARGHAPLAVAARDPQGRIAAMLVAVRVNTLGGPLSRVASRSIYYAEPICRDDATGAEALGQLVRLHDRRMAGVLFAEVRPLDAPGPERAVLEAHGYSFFDYLNYVVDLTPSEDELLARCKKSVRRQLKNNARRGLEVVEPPLPADPQQLYDHIRLSYARSAVPLADISLFRAALALLPAEVVMLRTVLHNGAPVGSSVSLAYKGRLYGWYMGSERHAGVSADCAITWEELVWGKRQGMTLYDFGGAGLPDEPYGPREFKAKFGGELTHFGRYRKVFGPIRLGIAKAAYGVARRFVAPACPAPEPEQD